MSGVSGRNGRMARAVALSARDVRRVGLTAYASRAGAVERRALPTAAVATLDNGVLRRVSRTPGKSLPHGGGPSPAAPDQEAYDAGPSLPHNPSRRRRLPSFPPRRTGWPLPRRRLRATRPTCGGT